MGAKDGLACLDSAAAALVGLRLAALLACASGFSTEASRLSLDVCPKLESAIAIAFHGANDSSEQPLEHAHLLLSCLSEALLLQPQSVQVLNNAPCFHSPDFQQVFSSTASYASHGSGCRHVLPPSA